MSPGVSWREAAAVLGIPWTSFGPSGLCWDVVGESLEGIDGLQGLWELHSPLSGFSWGVRGGSFGGS